MNEADICDAIRHRKRLTFTYRDRFRIVEPYAYGVDAGGTPILRAYQTGGQANSGVPAWKLFRADEVVDLQVTGDAFEAPHEGYMRNDPAMTKVYCEL